MRHYRNDDVNLEFDKLRRELGETVELPLRESISDCDVLSLDVAKLAKSFLKCVVTGERTDGGRTRR